MKNIISYLILILLIHSSNGYSQTDDNTVNFNLDGPASMRIVADKFKMDDYKFNVKNTNIMSGTNTGIEIEFMQNENEKSTLTLAFYLPSGNNFVVFSAGKGYVAHLPELPFTITNEDFTGIKSSQAGRNLIANIALIRNTRKSSDESASERVTFEIFSITINDFAFNNGKLTSSCSFTGSIKESSLPLFDNNYNISGKFKLKDYIVGVMKVDD